MFFFMVGRLFYCDLSGFDGEDVSSLGNVVKLVDNFDNLYSYITNEGRTFWFRTNMQASKYKVSTTRFLRYSAVQQLAPIPRRYSAFARKECHFLISVLPV